MWAFILQGLLLGFSLSFVIGPLFFSMVESALSRGTRVGLALAIGIWVSDLVFIFLLQKGLSQISAIAASASVRQWAGIAGGIMLLGFGVASWMKASKPVNVPDTFGQAAAKDARLDETDKDNFVPRSEYATAFLKGFVINSINPGTLVFWAATATGIVAPRGWTPREMGIFFTAMMAVLICTDTLKVYGANYLRTWLTPQHIGWVRKSIGVVLMVFGSVLLFESYQNS